jgi:uncharacterized protein with PIN domain
VGADREALVADLLCRALSFEASSSKEWTRPLMPNSTDGNNVSTMAGQTHQAGDDRTAERVAAAVSKSKRNLHDGLMAASSAAEAVRSAERRLKIKVEYALEAVYKLRCQLRSVPADGRKSLSSDAGVGRWSAEDFGYSITQLARLTLGDKFKPANLEACVRLLQLAEQENIAPKGFLRFMRKVGGVDVNTKVFHKLAEQPKVGTTWLKRPAKGQ